jgi:predicted RNase H-like nuclease (RuvC/YqgF family)
MGIIEGIAIIILLIAIAILVYYFVLNNSESFNGFNFKSPGEEEEMPGSGEHFNITFDDDKEDVKPNSRESSNYTEKFRDKINEYDMSSFSTDSFSQKIDQFLDEKSDQLIEDWSLATQNDLDTLERRWASANESIDELEKRFNEYSDVTNKRLDTLEERIKALEEDEDVEESND